MEEGDFDPILALEVVGEGMGVNELKMGVAPACSVTAGTGDSAASGVDAWRVAYKSGCAGGRVRPMLQARIKKSVVMIQIILFLRRVEFNRFKVKFLTRQNFGTITATIRTMDFSIYRMILVET